jgi:hypothetical protein
LSSIDELLPKDCTERGISNSDRRFAAHNWQSFTFTEAMIVDETAVDYDDWFTGLDARQRYIFECRADKFTCGDIALMLGTTHDQIRGEWRVIQRIVRQRRIRELKE